MKENKLNQNLKEQEEFFKKEKMLGHKLRLIHNAIDKYFDKCIADETNPIPRGQGMMLKYLMDHRDSDVFQKDLEKFFDISGATASNMLKSLEKNGFIKRQALESDARLKKIIITETGLLHESNIRSNIILLETTMEKGLSKEEISIYRDICDRIIQNLGQLNEDIRK